MSVFRNFPLTSGIFFVVFVLNGVSAQGNFELPQTSDLEPLDEIQELLQKVQTLYDAKIASKVQQGVVLDEEVEEKVAEVDGQKDSPPNSCSCALAICTCCKRIVVPKLGINNRYCLRLKYSRKTNSMWVTQKIDGLVVINTDVAVRNPQTICVPIQSRVPGAKICLEFQNVRVVSGWATGCSRILVYSPGGLVAVARLGCFRMHCTEVRSQVEGPQMQDVGDTEQVNFNEIPMEA